MVRFCCFNYFLLQLAASCAHRTSFAFATPISSSVIWMLLLLSLCGSVDIAFVSFLCPFRAVFKLLMFLSAVVTCCTAFDDRRSIAFVALCHLLKFFLPPGPHLITFYFPSPRCFWAIFTQRGAFREFCAIFPLANQRAPHLLTR